MQLVTVKNPAGDFDEVQVEAGELVWINNRRGGLVSVLISQGAVSITSYGPSPVTFYCPKDAKLDIERIGK
jgi:hypothetical protein